MNAADAAPPDREGRGVRAFVALGMSPEIASAAARFIAELQGLAGARAVRWTAPARLHLTLRFLGDEADPARIARLLPALGEIAQAFGQFPLAARGAGAFPDLKRPRVLWIGLGGAPLAELAARVEAAAVAAGFAAEPRRWEPHLTIGRIVRGRPPEPIRRAIAAAAAREFAAAIAESLILHRSILRPDGAEYRPLARFTLGFSDPL